jgi:hypothetical protein
MADITVFGKKISPAAAVAIAGGSGLAIWFAYKHHQASASSSDSSAIDPVTGLPYSEDDTTDPLTGMTYLAEAQQYGSVSAAEQAYAAESSADEAEDTGTGTDLTGSSAGVTTEVPAAGYTTNAQWAAAVTAGLTDLGYSAADVSAALGAYLGSLPETSAQAAIVNDALAEYGPPPVGTYTVILASSTGPTGSGTGGGATTGQPAGPVTGTTGAPVTVAPTGFRVVSVTGGDDVNLAWNAVKGATGYVIAYGPAPGSQQYQQGVGGGQTTEATVPGVGAGSAGKHYFELWATPAASGGPHAGPIEATTTKS